MNLAKYVIANVIETLFRFVPFAHRTGVLRIGKPDRSSPVFLTCSYDLTVQRVRRALQGIDCYLLVANSRGINVWCSAAGGLFTNHDVISALRTSGIEQLVDHREVVLPQLAAAGIELKNIEQKTGWRVIWGPVYAKDIPLFIRSGLKKSAAMRQVQFPLGQRIEMAIAWAVPISIILALVALFCWREAVLALLALTWGLSFVIFVSFPLYSRWLRSGGKRVGPIVFDFGQGGFQLILWVVLLLGLAAYSAAFASFDWRFILRWGLASFVVVLLLSIDLRGSTPVHKSALLEGGLFTVVLDEGKCKGAGYCEQVCPRNCYEVDKTRRMATMPRADRCVRCAACIVQCPFDALCFKSAKGESIPPETIRKFKLNLMGKRLVSS
jgi:NAD-dependent dihydropyrimidine dehydrogenase PreA subunit